MQRARMRTLRNLPSLARYETEPLRLWRISCLKHADEEKKEKGYCPGPRRGGSACSETHFPAVSGSFADQACFDEGQSQGQEER